MNRCMHRSAACPAQTSAMKAPAMRSLKHKKRPKLEPEEPERDLVAAATDDNGEAIEVPAELEDDELDAIQLREDVFRDAFIFDDDGEPLPDYGDFWFPD